MTLDDKLRAMAREDTIPLPQGYDSMLAELCDTLTASGGSAPAGERKEKYHMKKRALRWNRLVAAAVVAALMVGSLVVGALAFSQPPQETIVMEDLGLTLLLPDNWKGRYVTELPDSDTCRVYAKAAYEDPALQVTDPDGRTVRGGLLFYIYRMEGFRTPEQAEAEVAMPSEYLFATAEATYLLCYASDVQYNPANKAQAEEYVNLYRQLPDIQVVVQGAMG